MPPIFRMLANGDSVESLMRTYPSLQREDILACFDYAASLAEEEVIPVNAYGQETDLKNPSKGIK